MHICLEYIWIDGSKPTRELRSKTKVIKSLAPVNLNNAPDWGFDGSSTGQAEGNYSDVILKPVFVCTDPLRGTPHRLVLCETYGADGTPHATNTRHDLAKLMKECESQEPLMGIEQEYVFLEKGSPLGWPDDGYPSPQGPFYCGVGASKVSGRQIVDSHLQACLTAGLPISGINAEVMPGQWEFQVGTADPLVVSDSLWVARWILYRIAEEHGVDVTLEPKPIKGDWNGSGAHTNFSTLKMRQPNGIRYISEACEKLAANINSHLAVYGHDLKERLTGEHETCPYDEFRWGVGDRGASIRVPLHVYQEGCGYLEDRRPCSNIDPYEVSIVMLETICT